MTELWNWLADAALVMLLTATLVMAVRLDRALRVIRRDRAVFETLITNLGAATGSVKAGIQALRTEADRAAEQIERRTMEADKMATDLSFLVESADRAGARLEQTLRSTNEHKAEQAPATPAPPDNRVAMPATATAPASEYRTAPWTGLATAAKPVLLAEWPGSESQFAAAAGTPSATSLDDLREMAGITTRRPQRPEDSAALPSAVASAALVKLVG